MSFLDKFRKKTEEAASKGADLGKKGVKKTKEAAK